MPPVFHDGKCQFGYDIFGENLRKLEPSEFSTYLRTLTPFSAPLIGAFGDSHLRTYFCPDEEVYAAAGVTAHLAYISGASLTGFGRRTSSKGHFSKIEAYCRTLRPTYILLKFGQVDFEQGYYYRKAIKGEKISFAEFAERLLASYQDAVDALAGLTDIVICALNPPTIRDPQDYAQTIRTIILENIPERKAAEIYLRHLPRYIDDYAARAGAISSFNAMLGTMRGIARYIDKTDFFLENGSLKDSYWQKDDVHIPISDEDRKRLTRSILTDIFRK